MLSIAKPIGSVAPGRRRYPLTLDTLEHALEAFNIPLPFVSFVASHTTIAMDFDTVQAIVTPNTANTQRTGIICVLGPIALAVSFNSVTEVTTGVVLGLCDHQAAKLNATLRNVPDVVQIPMLLPAIILNVLGETRAHRVLGRKQAINGTEVQLGVHWGVQAGQGPSRISLETATRQLTVCGSEVAWDMHAIEAQLEMVGLIEEVQESINGVSKAPDDHARTMLAFRARTRRIRQVLSGLMHWTRYNQQRVQVQLQTVTYSSSVR